MGAAMSDEGWDVATRAARHAELVSLEAARWAVAAGSSEAANGAACTCKTAMS